MSSLTRRPLLLSAVAAVLVPATAYLFFELGRYEAGYSVMDRQREIDAYEQVIDDHERTILEQKRQLAILETSREIDSATYAQLELSLGELEAKIQSQEEELAFYRGIISPPDGVAGLRIQSLEVLPSTAEQRYLLKLVLMQAIVHNRRVTGVVRVSLTGTRGEETVELTLEELTGDAAVPEIAYGFRYFQGFEQELVIPGEFAPATVRVEILPSEPRGDPVTREYEWSAVSG